MVEVLDRVNLGKDERANAWEAQLSAGMGGKGFGDIAAATVTRKQMLTAWTISSAKNEVALEFSRTAILSGDGNLPSRVYMYMT